MTMTQTGVSSTIASTTPIPANVGRRKAAAPAQMAIALRTRGASLADAASGDLSLSLRKMARNMKKPRARSPAKKPVSPRGSSRELRNGIAASYVAYAVAADGSRQPLDAARIVVDLGGTEIEIDLTVAHPILAGRLHVAARGEGLLVVGPADASSICVAVEPICGGRLKPS